MQFYTEKSEAKRGYNFEIDIIQLKLRKVVEFLYLDPLGSEGFLSVIIEDVELNFMYFFALLFNFYLYIPS